MSDSPAHGHKFEGQAEAGWLNLAQIAEGLAAALLVASVINPDHFPPWTSYHSEGPAFVAGVLLLLVCGLRRVSRLSLPIAILFGLVATPWLQWAGGLMQYSGDAWVTTVYLGVFAAAWWWGASERPASEARSTLDLLVACLLVMGLLASFQALAQWAQVEALFSDWIYVSSVTRRSTGNLAQPNQLSTLLLMAVAAGAVWMVRGRIGLLAGWAWLLLAGWAVVLTQSRTGLLSAIVLVATLGASSLVRPSLRRWNKHALIWLSLLFVAAWILQTAQWHWARDPLGAEAMTSVGLRPVIWRQMLAAAAQSPWLGYGWLQVAAAQQAGAMSFPGIEQVTNAHNVVLDAIVMLGLPLTLLLLGLAATWLFRRAIRLRDDDDGTGLAAICIVLPWLVHAQLELPHAYAYFLVPVGALLGVLDSRTGSPRDMHIAIVPWLPPVLAAALGSILIGLAWQYASVEEDFRVNRFENRKLGSTPPEYAIPELAMLTQFRDLLRGMRLRAAPGMASEDLEVLVRSSKRYTWAPLLFRTALALALNGRPDEARERLLVIRNLFPAEVVAEGRDNWRKLQQEQYPELSSVPFP